MLTHNYTYALLLKLSSNNNNNMAYYAFHVLLFLLTIECKKENKICDIYLTKPHDDTHVCKICVCILELIFL